MNGLGLFLSACIALFAGFSAAEARLGIAAQVEPNELGAALEVEVTYFEFQLAAHAYTRDKAELKVLLDSGYSYEVADSKERVTRRARVALAKRLRMQAVAAEFSRHPSEWVRSLAAAADVAAGARVKRSLPNRSLASEGENDSGRARALVEAVATREYMVLLRWESLRDLLGTRAVNEFVRAHYGFRELGPPNPVIPDSAPNPADIVVVGAGEEERADLATVAGAHGFRLRVFKPSGFAQLGEHAQELRNFLAESPGAVNVVSYGEGATIVRTLLDQYSTLRTDGTIRAWINVNGELYGRNFAGIELDPDMPGRALASATETYLRAQARTDILLGLGKGFAIASLVGARESGSDRFNLFHAAYPGGDNYIFVSEAGSGLAAVEVLERAIGSAK